MSYFQFLQQWWVRYKVFLINFNTIQLDYDWLLTGHMTELSSLIGPQLRLHKLFTDYIWHKKWLIGGHIVISN